MKLTANKRHFLDRELILLTLRGCELKWPKAGFLMFACINTSNMVFF